MYTYRLEVNTKIKQDFSKIERTIWDNEDKHFKILSQRKIYLLNCAQEIDLSQIKAVFFDDIIEEIHATQSFQTHYARMATILFRPGVTDNAGLAAQEALALLGITAIVASGTMLEIESEEDNITLQSIVEKYFMNSLIQQVELHDSTHDRFQKITLPEVKLSEHQAKYEYINIFCSSEKLNKLSKERCLALNLNEFYHIQSYLQDESIKHIRDENRLLDQPTDVELEIIAQSWSEHCKHKIFSAHIKYEEAITDPKFKKLGSQKIHSLYKTFIKNATHEIVQQGCDWTVSVFSDNAGVVNFDSNINCCIKVETHNSPSALDPYGGAITGILGVNRDILGCGMGAKPIANTNVLCFADPNWPQSQKHLLPVGPRAPHETLTGVHKGIEDGGNKSGIPTVNGAFYFDRDYAGKPLVYCGTIGILPKQLENGMDAAKKHIQKGDRVFMVGGAIGADGIHGATFSSMELDENSPATAVQIGDPLVQKRMMDFILAAQAKCLFSGITDNGAGGLSSSVGEMAQATNGVLIDVARCPTKYPGLLPYELVISESQERMTVAVPPKHAEDFKNLAAMHGVNATDIGEFTDSGYFSIDYNDVKVAHLSLAFLHDSLPYMQLEAYWDNSVDRKPWGENATPTQNKVSVEHYSVLTALEKLLGRLNIASKEKWIRRYDHEVGAATQLKPLQGQHTVSPNNSGVIALEPYGGESDTAIAIGCGIAPRLSLYDPYYMAQYTVDEAVRNVVAVGADPEKICILDNFCWPDPVDSSQNPEGKYRLGQLVRTSAGLYDAALAYRTPIVSGKDSMKNNFSGVNQSQDKINIAVLPTLLVTSMAKVNSRHVIDSAFKQDGDLIYVLGQQSLGLAYSELQESYDIQDDQVPEINLNINKLVYKQIHCMIQKNILASCHDISDGGLLVALAESCFSKQLGVDLKVDEEDNPLSYYFNEGCGRFIVSVSKAHSNEFIQHIQSIPHQLIGLVTEEPIFKLNNESIAVNSLYQSWSTQFETI